MPRYEHLRLLRLPEQFERRKKPGFGGVRPPRDQQGHSNKLREELAAAIQVQQHRRNPHFVNPSLVLRVQMVGTLLEEDWTNLGLTVLSTDADRTLVLFSTTDDLRDFRQRLEAYSNPTPTGQRNPAYAGFIEAIESIGAIESKDRIGIKLREEGFSSSDDFSATDIYILDLELWEFGGQQERRARLDELSAFIENNDGEVVDTYNGPSISMARIKVNGALLKVLLEFEDISVIDLPPTPDLQTSEITDMTLPELPELEDADPEAPIIGIIDSGINSHPLLDDIVVGSIAVPETLGTVDAWGHGTKISGVAIFGDLRTQLAEGTLIRSARICSAKVVNDQGDFDDKKLVPAQMREAIETLYRQHGCRIFVIALGDRKKPYKDGKVGTWAATLDELARELNVLILVSAGNSTPNISESIEDAVTRYPNYLTEPGNRFFEPAGAINVVTVGSIAHGEGVTGGHQEEVGVRPITRLLEPSPFTRAGPGMKGGIKPDVVDFGGTLVFDPAVQRLHGGEQMHSAGIVTLYHKPIDRLFTAGSGTSYATPLVAHKASQILKIIPSASANLLRALLVGAAEVPFAARECLAGLGEDATSAICGHGHIDTERAAYSDDARVVLYAEDELPLDHFAVYAIPIPELYQQEAGRRRIRVTLAFDPPVRHTRADYAGNNMSYRLVRGCNPDLIFEHYRKREQEDGPFPEIPKRFSCDLKPGPNSRDKGTVQTSSVTFSRDVSSYGDSYYLVVRCESGWAKDHLESQRFAVVVEISHEAEILLYQRVRVRVTA